MNLNKLRKVNIDRVSYFGHGTIDNGWNVAEWGCALGGECGELLNVLKKIHRNAEFDPNYIELRKLAAEEIADVVIYLDLIAAKLDLNLGACIVKKFNKTSVNCGFPQRL